MTATAPLGRSHPSSGPRLNLRDERGSLPMLMMVILVGVVLSTFMVSVVISQTTSTRFTTSREQALNAAQAGTDVALARIRASVAAGAGALTKLPCWTSALPYAGSVVSDTGGTTQVGSGSYTVFVDYFTTNPVTDPPRPPMVCSTGYGTFDRTSLKSTPSFALITSTGSVVGGGANGTTAPRTLVSTYAFKVDNRNISGGTIELYPKNVTPRNPKVCLQAVNATPDPGTAVTVADCSDSTPPARTQVFAYRTDLTIQLISSVTEANKDGMCLDGGTFPAAGASVFLRQCAPLDPAVNAFDGANRWQQWSFNGLGHLEGSTSTSRDTGTLSNVCITAASPASGTPVTIAGCSGGTNDQYQAWIPNPDVGAGAATGSRGGARQYVNFSEFGRCMDVTNNDVNINHFIDYPCKQNPKAGSVDWNQKFTATPSPAPAPANSVQLRTTAGSTTWCVTSPLTDGGYVRLSTPCATTATDPLAASQRWVDNADALAYSAKATLVDSAGRCLGLALPYVNGTVAEQWSTIVVKECKGQRDQKWNAAANLSDTSLQNTIEK